MLDVVEHCLAKISGTDFRLVLEEKLRYLPKCRRLVKTFRGFGCGAGPRMRGQRIVQVHELDALAICR